MAGCKTNLLHGHASAEDRSDGEIAAMAWITRSHHVLGVEHLLCEFGHSEGAVLLTAARRQRSKAWHEEVETREWNHVHGQLAQVSIQLSQSTATIVITLLRINNRLLSSA